MTLKNELLENPRFEFRNDIFYQKNLSFNKAFEETYLKIRKKENRLYADALVEKLPDVDEFHPNKSEWAMRKYSLNQLMAHLKKTDARSLLELGCGNGWLSHRLSVGLDAQICAIDINEMELIQAGRVFKSQDNLCFVYGDIFSSIFSQRKFDAIILASSIQYFSDIRGLLGYLLNLTKPFGQIYIADTPFYHSTNDASAAKKRSQNHFDTMGCPEMADRYFHHTYESLNGFAYTIQYDPHSYINMFKRKILKASLPVFPLICVTSK